VPAKGVQPMRIGSGDQWLPNRVATLVPAIGLNGPCENGRPNRVKTIDLSNSRDPIEPPTT